MLSTVKKKDTLNKGLITGLQLMKREIINSYHRAQQEATESENLSFCE